MADVPVAVPPQLIGEIVAACRLELAYWIPVLLAPLVEELREIKAPGSPEKERGPDQLCTPLPRSRSLPFDERHSSLPSSGDPTSSCRSQSLPPGKCLEETSTAQAGRAGPAAAEELTTAPSSFGDRPLEGCQKDSEAGDQQSKTQLEEPASDFLPLDFETDLCTPLVDPAGPPDDDGVHHWYMRNLYRGESPSARGVYHLTPRCDTTDEPTTELLMMAVDSDGNEYSLEIMDPEAAERLPKEIATLEAKLADTNHNLEDLDNMWQSRRRPYDTDITNVRKEIEKLQEELEQACMLKNPEPPPPGPVALKFVDSGAFSAVCNLVVLLNLTAMIVGPKFKSYASIFKMLDHVFLAWYVTELSVKGVYYQRKLICGKISVVWWNWLDLGIVVSGVVDQWLMPLLAVMNGGHLNINVSALRMLRLLRLFRIMRFLKIAKAFLKSDFEWTEGAAFEWTMAGVIAFNSVIMSIELDTDWACWPYVENLLQVVYSFELALRLKRQGCNFFRDMENVVWNYLDFIMVGGGAMDLWLVPLIYTLRAMIFGTTSQNSSEDSLSGVLKILKIMRILRVLRLVRLLKMVKPLYRLLTGVIASIKAMQWVMVLTFLTLYACSIVFTNLVGKGLLSAGEVTDLADLYFGSVPKSLFSLFKLMNGEMSVVEPITGSILGQLLFAGFMVVSNWAILAILTAVVSDNMITASQKAHEEDENIRTSIEHEKRIRRLTTLFKEIDQDGEGSISHTEWQKMLDDRSLQHELCDATGLHEEDLNDYFECLAKDPQQEERDKLVMAGDMEEICLDYQTFIDALKDEGMLADKRSILHVMKQLRILETDNKRSILLLVNHLQTLEDRVKQVSVR